MNFYETGNVFACVNEKNEVKLFNAKLEMSEVIFIFIEGKL